MNIERTRDLLAAFDFHGLFIELGWSQPSARKVSSGETAGLVYSRRMIAQLAGVAVFEVWADKGLPDRAGRDAIEREIARDYRENLCIFLDRPKDATQSIWVWANRAHGENGKPRRVLREHAYFRGQPADLFISKLQVLFFELSEVSDIGNLTVVEVARRLRDALDVERVTKKFFRAYQEQHEDFLSLIEGIEDERDRRWYASIILNRLMFVWFLQEKGFLDHDPSVGHGDFDYLTGKLEESRTRGPDRFFGEFLNALFFEAFAKPENEREGAARALTGNIPYLNGGLFLHHRLELDAHGQPRVGLALRIPDVAFKRLFALFDAYSWSLDDTPGGKSDEINPDVLGYIFEKYINQKAFGAYYTRPEITEYLCERTIHALLLRKVNCPALPELGLPEIRFDSVPELLARMDDHLCHKLVKEYLPSLTLLDPAVGSGAFLVAAMKVLINLYTACVGRAKMTKLPALAHWLAEIERHHKSVLYYVKRRIVTDNLFGVDLMEEATEIARLRLFLALVASARDLADLEPLPNIDFNIMAGNSLVGLMRIDEHEFEKKQAELFAPSYRDLLREKNQKVTNYRNSADDPSLRGAKLEQLKTEIDVVKAQAIPRLNELLRDAFEGLGIKFEEATWDAARHKEGRPRKRQVAVADIEAQRPFHWGYEFDQIMQQRGGFDVIITNPPWEVFQTDEKEFFQDYDARIQKNKLRLEDWKRQFADFMRIPEIRSAWLEYSSRFPHMSKWFKLSPQYKHQTSAKINLYLLFVEQCYHLLKPDGQCGIVIPSGIYTDLGAQGLRELLFERTRIEGLFCFENRKEIFEGVHRSFKFVVLTFEKCASQRLAETGEGDASAPPADLLASVAGTRAFPAAFMRHDVAELARFPGSGAIEIPVELVRRLAPDSLAIPEFKSALDMRIAEKLFEFPLLGQQIGGKWSLGLSQEFNMTTDHHLFKTAPGKGRLPLIEGKVIHQFDAAFGEPKYWLDEAEARAALMKARLKQTRKLFEARQLGEEPDEGVIRLDYESYRLAFRDVARNTDERTFIGAVLPPKRFCPHTMSLERVFTDAVENGEARYNVVGMDGAERLYLLAALNSFTADYLFRQRVTAHLSFFFVYNLPVPRLTAADPTFAPVVERAARLTCTTPDFDALAKEVGLKRHQPLDSAERARLRAELDGLVAHLYGLTEAEFVHILTTFPLVDEATKLAARNAYRDVERGLIP